MQLDALRVLKLSKPAMVALDVAAWAAWSAVAGYVAHRRPASAFARDTWLTRLHPWEAGGAVYERRLRVRRWKDSLPEAGALFAGGFSKRTVAGGRRDHLARFVVETRRAEWAHWLVMAATPVFFLWNYWGVGLVMIVYAVAANGPCLVVQRYNRARLLRVLRRRGHPDAPA